MATAYMFLATAIAWTFSSAFTLVMNPAHIAAHVLGAANGLANVLAFLSLRRRADPRAAIDWIAPLNLITASVLALGHSGVIAPIVFTLPTLAGVCAIYQRPQMRQVSLVLGLITMCICMAAAIGLIGEPTTYTPRAYVVVSFIILLSTTLALGGLAWISILSRDYSLEQIRIANDAIVDAATSARLALEAARVGLWDVPNIDKRQFNLSDSFQAVTGYTSEEFNNLFGNMQNVIHQDDIAPLQAAFRAGRERGLRVRIDFRLLTKTRGYRWFSARARYAPNPDGGTRVSGSLQDINFIKVAEEAMRVGRDQARAANKAKTDFIAVMSHEVRTPLNAILGSVDLLKRRVDDRQANEMLDLIDEAGRGLLAIVNDMLDVSRIDAGKLDIAPAPADIAALVTRAADFWGPQAADRGIALTVDSSKADSTPLLVDAGRIRQIVGNLISNAIKFTDEGTVHARVETRAAPNGRTQITISVTDTGRGVPDESAESIFAAFEQAPGDASRGGAGLGLFISRRLARMMGGDLTLDQSYRNGAQFRLTLAAEPADADTAEPAPAPAFEGEQAPWAGLQLLCVDDNENNRRIAELLLGHMGFQVTLAASGAEAVDICAMQVFDVILMDIVMPDMDGVQTLQALRADDDSLNRGTPTIALTAKLSPEDLASYLAAGFDGIAGKPIELPALAREFGRVLAARMAQAEQA